MKEAIKGLSSLILRLQGDGNKTKVLEIMTNNGIIKEGLQKDLDRLSKANIPVDIVFEQGLDVLGLQ
jgi:predicted DNA-binding transcriptional regulator YafY